LFQVIYLDQNKSQTGEDSNPALPYSYWSK